MLGIESGTGLHRIRVIVLQLPSSSSSSELMSKLDQLQRQMDAFKRSFAYIGDYISLSGYKLWQEELTRVIGYGVEQECNTYLKHMVIVIKDYAPLA